MITLPAHNSPTITAIQKRKERNGSVEQVELTPEEVTARFKELARQGGKRINAAHGIGAEEVEGELAPLHADLTVVKFVQRSIVMNCPCCGYLGYLVLERDKRLRTVLKKLWRCQQCRATIEVTVRI